MKYHLQPILLHKSGNSGEKKFGWDLILSFRTDWIVTLQSPEYDMREKIMYIVATN